MIVSHAWAALLFLTVSLCALTIEGQGPAVIRKPFFERLRRLDEQFRRFQEVTLTQLQGIAENYNISYNIDARFQQLAEQQQNLSDSLTAFQASTATDLSSLKQWTKKLQKKTERLDLRMSDLERSLEETSKKVLPPGESPQVLEGKISNITQELQEHRARLDAISADRYEVRGGLRELGDSIGKQESRMVQLEEQVRGSLEQIRANLSGDGNLTPQDLGPRAMMTEQGYMSPKIKAKLQLKHSRGKKVTEDQRLHPGAPQPKTELHPYAHLEEEPIELWDQAEPHHQNEPTDLPDSGQTHRQEQPVKIWEKSQPHTQKEPEKIWEKLQPHPEEEPEEIRKMFDPYPQEEPKEIWEQVQTHRQEQPISILEHSSISMESQSRPQEESMEIWEQSLPHPQEEPLDIWEQPEPYAQEKPVELWEMPHQQEELRDVLDLLQLPMRHKIPQHQHYPKNTGTICNIKSSLIFPSPSAENYVTFRRGFARGVHELSVCTWLKIEQGARYIGTLLSYATEDNDNKLVLYGRNSTRQGTLDFVIGDPVYRELPVGGMLDGDWHHLCVVWSAIEGRFWHYTDRRLTSTGSKFRKGYEIPSGGVVVLGQEQDSMGGGFDEAEAFVGSLAGFAAWDRALSPGEVSDIATGRSLPRGAILTLDDIDQPNGDVRLVRCNCLESCIRL